MVAVSRYNADRSDWQHYIEEEGAMGMVRVLCSHGDSRYSWDQQAARSGDLDAKAAVREAERIFDQQRARGAQAIRVNPVGALERIHLFDPDAEQILLVPRVVGG